MKVKKAFLIISFILPLVLLAQRTKIYEDKYVDYRDGMELYDKVQYAAAQEKFNRILENIDDHHDELRISAQYYAAICALELFNKDAEYLLRKFVVEHPDDNRAKSVYFLLGKHHYRKKRFRKAIEWFDIVEPRDLSEKMRNEFFFKYGYAHFNRDEFDEARLKFAEIKDGDSEYAVPATYYYAHIAYLNKDYQVALQGFQKIQYDESFKKVVPYYITQIYYRQKKYDEILAYAPQVFDSVTESRKTEFSKIIGDAYYKKGNYKEAIVYFEYHAHSTKQSSLDKFQLGYCYYQEKEYRKAIAYFNRITSTKDSIAQYAYYHMADAYQNLGELTNAKTSFKVASELDFDAEIKEESAYNYIKILYREGVVFSLDELTSAITDFQNQFPNSAYNKELDEFLIDAYLSSKNYKEALDKINSFEDKSFRLKTAYQVAAFNYAVELYNRHDSKDAITYFKEVKRYPFDQKLNAKSLFWLAEAYYNDNQLDLAIESYKSFKLEPGSYTLKHNRLVDYNLGYCYFKKHDYETAISYFRNYVEDEKQDNNRLFDAYSKLGDAYFILKDDEQAGIYYAKSAEINSDYADYAMYQQARSYGLNQKHEKKAEILERLIQNYPQSSYYSSSLYELGEVYFSYLKQNQKALSYFERFLEEFPNNSRVSSVLINIGKIHLNNKNFTEAERIFTQIVNDYPNSDQREVAIKLMKSVYEDQDNLSGYTAWMQKNNIDYSQQELDSTFFAVAMEAYEVESNQRDCNKVIKLFKDYLKNVAQPLHYTEAHYYIAYCYDTKKEYDNAVKHYSNVIEHPNNKFIEEALYRSSQINFYVLKNYNAALSNFASLEKITANSERLRASVIGQMYCFDKLNNYEFAAEYAEKVLQFSDLDESKQTDAYYIHAKANFKLKKFGPSEASFKKVAELTKDVRSAEAFYHMALFRYMEGNYEASEKACQKVVNQKPGYNYWIAKAIILLSDNFVAQEDYFNAKHSLQSIIDNYKGNDDILPTAKAKLQAIIELENQERIKQEEKEEEESLIDYMIEDTTDLKLFLEDDEDKK